MRNHLVGINASAAYSVRNLDLTFGGSWSYYSCPHWGTLDWVDGLKKSDIRGRWYDNDVDKQDANVFVRANWTVARGLRLFADMPIPGSTSAATISGMIAPPRCSLST